MIFKNPQILWGLFAIAIPLIIHLFNFKKYKKVYFSNLSMLKYIEMKTKRQSQLKHLLVLLSRILMIAALVFAFAQPYIPANKSSEQKNIAVYIDNSFSMKASTKNGSAINRAKLFANEIAKAYGNKTKYLLITNDFNTKHSYYLSKDQFIIEVDNIEISSKNSDFKEVTNYISSLNKESKSNKIYFISDFQKSQFSLENTNFENKEIEFIKLTSVENDNLYIDSIWIDEPFLSTEKSFDINYRVHNFSNKEIDKSTVNLYINNDMKGLANSNIEPNSSTVNSINITPEKTGINTAKLSLTDASIDFDNEFFFNFNIKSKLNILDIRSDNFSNAIESFFKIDSTFNYESVNINQINFSELPNYNLIILNQLSNYSSGLINSLLNYLDGEATIFIIPSNLNQDNEKLNILLQNLNIPQITSVDSFETKISGINTNSREFKDVFEDKDEVKESFINFPVVKKYLVQSSSSSDVSESILTLSNQRDILKSYKVKNDNRIYLLLTSLKTSHTNLSKHSLFVPMLYNIAISSNKKNNIFYKTTDKNISFTYKNTMQDQVLTVKNKQSNFEIIPPATYRANKSIIDLSKNNWQAGNYMVYDNSEKLISGFSLNYPRNESKMSFYNDSYLENFADKNANITISNNKPEQLRAEIVSNNTDNELWIIFIIMGLMFILIEVILLRFLK